MIPSRELDEILAQEITRRIGGYRDPPPTLDALRSALHVLKGSAGMAGHHDLALLVTQYGQRIRSGEVDAVIEVIDLLRATAERLENGLTPFDAHWPEPPPGLVPSQIPSDQRDDYLDAMHDQLCELESMLRVDFDDENQLVAACRSVHTLKALASGVGDDVTAWYCHHLEARLRHPDQASPSIGELALEISNHLATLQRLLESPDHALEMLRSLAPERHAKRASQPVRLPSEPPGLERSASCARGGRGSTFPPGEDTEVETDAAIRVPATALGQFSDQVERLGIIADQLLGTSDEAHHLARTLHDLRTEFVHLQRSFADLPSSASAVHPSRRLADAIASVTNLAADATRFEQNCRNGAEALRSDWQEARHRLGQLRRTSLARVFARCERAAHRYAEAEGKRLQVETIGGEWSIERSLAERLVEPLLQIIKNAVSHGIELPQLRLACGKPEAGSLRLTAEPQGERLRLVVEDDGHGVDMERVRRRAVEQGLLTTHEASELGENELLNLLFVPGLSTCSDPGMIAGRGMGLDLARDVARRLGGGISLSAVPHAGVRVTLDFPLEIAQLEMV